MDLNIKRMRQNQNKISIQSSIIKNSQNINTNATNSIEQSNQFSLADVNQSLQFNDPKPRQGIGQRTVAKSSHLRYSIQHDKPTSLASNVERIQFDPGFNMQSLRMSSVAQKQRAGLHDLQSRKQQRMKHIFQGSNPTSAMDSLRTNSQRIQYGSPENNRYNKTAGVSLGNSPQGSPPVSPICRNLFQSVQQKQINYEHAQDQVHNSVKNVKESDLVSTEFSKDVVSRQSMGLQSIDFSLKKKANHPAQEILNQHSNMRAIHNSVTLKNSMDFQSHRKSVQHESAHGAKMPEVNVQRPSTNQFNQKRQHRTFQVVNQGQDDQLKSSNQLEQDSIFNSRNYQEFSRIQTTSQSKCQRFKKSVKRTDEPRDSYNDALFSSMNQKYIRKNKDLISQDVRKEFQNSLPHQNSRQAQVNTLVECINSQGSSPSRKSINLSLPQAIRFRKFGPKQTKQMIMNYQPKKTRDSYLSRSPPKNQSPVVQNQKQVSRTVVGTPRRDSDVDEVESYDSGVGNTVLPKTKGELLKDSLRQKIKKKVDHKLQTTKVAQDIQDKMMETFSRKIASSKKMLSSSRNTKSQEQMDEEQERLYQEMLFHKTDFVATYTMMETKYKINADDHEKLFKILDKNIAERKAFVDNFIEKVSRVNRIDNKEQFKKDLKAYLAKQRYLLAQSNEAKHQQYIQNARSPPPQDRSQLGVKRMTTSVGSRSRSPTKQPQQTRDIGNPDDLRCQVHTRIQKSKFDIYMPNCCQLEKNMADDKFQNESQKDLFATKDPEKTKPGYKDVDEVFLKNMEIFLKHQYDGVMNNKTSRKIKAIDAILSLINTKNGQRVPQAAMSLQKLTGSQDHDCEVCEMATELPEEYQQINILKDENESQIKSNQGGPFKLNLNIAPKVSPIYKGEILIKNQKKVLEGMNKLITQNLGLLMGNSTAQHIDKTKVQVDQRQIFVPNVANSVMITNQKVIKDLLNSKNATQNEIVLGRAFQDQKEIQINQMVKESVKKIYHQAKQKDDLISKVMNVQTEGKSKESEIKTKSIKGIQLPTKMQSEKNVILKSNLGLLSKMGTVQEEKSQGKPQEQGNKKPKDLLSSMKAMMVQKYEEKFNEMMRQRRIDEQKKLQDSFNWLDIAHKDQIVIDIIFSEYTTPPDKNPLKDPRKILTTMYMEQKEIEPIDVKKTHQQFFYIVAKILKAEVDKQQEAILKDQGMIKSAQSPYSPASPNSPNRKGEQDNGLDSQRSNLSTGRFNRALPGQEKQSYNIFSKYSKNKKFFEDIKTNPNSVLTMHESKHQEFHQTCIEKKVLTVPAFASMVQNGTIYINNYRMDKVLLNAFLKYVEEVYSKDFGSVTPRNALKLQSLIINKCGFNDEQVSLLISLLSKFKNPINLSITNDEFGNDSIQNLKPLIMKGLKKLTIQQAKLPNRNSQFPQIFDSLQYGSQLKSLSLISLNLTSNVHIFNSLIEYIQSMPIDLISLTLKDINLKSKHLKILTESLKENGILQDCDLSYNKMCRGQDQINLDILKNMTEFVKQGKALRHLALQGMHISVAIEGDDAEGVNKGSDGALMLSKFKNSLAAQVQEQVASVSLKPHQQFGVLIHAIATSQSIQSVHLSDNGFDNFQIEQIKQRFGIWCKKKEEKLDTNKLIMLNKLKEMYLTHEVNSNPKLTDHAKMINSQLIQQLEQSKTIHIKNRKVESNLLDVFYENLVLQRNIGHSELVFDNQFQGSMVKDFSKKWNVEDCKDKAPKVECFFCNRHRYVQIFFRRETILQDFEILQDEKIIQILNKVYAFEEAIQNRKLLNPGLKFNHPIIFGSVTDWNSHEMLGAHLFTKLLMYYYLKNKVKELGKDTDTMLSSEQRKPKGLPPFDQLMDKMFETSLNKLFKNQNIFDRVDFTEQVPNWYKILHNFKRVNKDITQVNMFAQLGASETDVYAFCAFLKPGLHSILIYDPLEKQYYKKTIVIEVNPNEENIVMSDKMLQELMLELKLARQQEINAFEQWEADVEPLSKELLDFANSRRLKNACEKDILPKNFKPYYFMPSQHDIQECLEHHAHYFRAIRNLYFYLSATRGENFSAHEDVKYPFISLNRIKDFMVEINLVKTGELEPEQKRNQCAAINPQIDQITMDKIAQIFKDTNYEFEDDEENPDDAFNRIEVLEFLMRVAVVQNSKQTLLTCHKHQDENISCQFENILKSYIMPYTEQKIDPLMNFRDHLLIHSQDISILLDANYRGLSLLYSHYKAKGFETTFGLKSFQEILKDQKIELSDDELHLLFGASKMVVVDESKSWTDYYKLELIEFHVLVCLFTKHYFEKDLGASEKASEDEVEYEAYKLEKLNNAQFCGEWVIFILRKLLKALGMKAVDYDDVKNQQQIMAND